MPSRYTLYSTNLLDCANDEELFRKIAERDAARAISRASGEVEDFLDIILYVESDEEILSGIDAFVDPDAAVDWSNKVTESVSSEVTAPPAKWSSKVIASPAKLLSNKVTRRFRSSIANDLQTIYKIKEFGKATPTSNPAPLVAILNPSETLPSTDPLSIPKAFPSPSNDNHIPVYEKGSDLLKLTMSNEVLETSGAPVVSWTLDLTPERIAEALSHPKGFTDSLARDFKRASMRELGREPLFWFHVDISKAGHLHLHGAIDANTQERASLERALRHVGGHGPKPERNDHMVHLNPDRCDEGWVIYTSRNRGAVRKALGSTASIYTIARPLRREAADLYGWIRKSMRR